MTADPPVSTPLPVPRAGARAAGRSSSSTRSSRSSTTASPTTTSSGPRSSSAWTTTSQLLADPTFWLALKHSLIYLIVTPILIVLSIALAIVVNRKLRGIHIFRALYFVPAVSGSIAIGLAWRWLFDRNGFINSVLLSLGLIQTPIQWLANPSSSLPIAMLLTIWAGVGYYSVIFLAGLQNIPEELYDAAAHRRLQRPPEALAREHPRAAAADHVRGGDLEPRRAQGVRRDLRPDRQDRAASSTRA